MPPQNTSLPNFAPVDRKLNELPIFAHKCANMTNLAKMKWENSPNEKKKFKFSLSWKFIIISLFSLYLNNAIKNSIGFWHWVKIHSSVKNDSEITWNHWFPFFFWFLFLSLDDKSCAGTKTTRICILKFPISLSHAGMSN